MIDLEELHEDWQKDLLPPPCTIEEARKDSRWSEDGFIKKIFVRRYHPGMTYSIRSSRKVVKENEKKHGFPHSQQGTYDENGKLFTSGKSAPTPDSGSH